MKNILVEVENIPVEAKNISYIQTLVVFRKNDRIYLYAFWD